ncbi:repressor LexA [Magnetovirga frankeli]|uniref:transcriptional repressor LexA n=1 Tax=Magnetovirga frankeli TaxID=947516 RepID=UPI0012939B30|nr:repressor LexA [gamma proteobacterium SS-5]
MNNLFYLNPNRQQPLWHPDLQPLFTEADEVVEIPLLGYVSAGQPVDIPEERENVLIPKGMLRKNSYALRVRGYSMVDENIQDGDIIVIEKRETAANGQTVVAMINGEQVTLKRFYIEAEGIRLQPANQAMQPIYLRHEQVQILGIVSGVIRHCQ